MRSDPALELSQCMRSHGVPNFPDPGPGGGLQVNSQSGINPQAPAFQAAQRACRRFAPSFPAPGMSAVTRARAVAFAKCMRAHGQTSFPDPTIGAPNPGITGRILALRGMFFAVGPTFNPRSPAFRQAAAACGLTPPQR